MRRDECRRGGTLTEYPSTGQAAYKAKDPRPRESAGRYVRIADYSYVLTEHRPRAPRREVTAAAGKAPEEKVTGDPDLSPE